MLLTFAIMNLKRKKIVSYWLFSGLTIVILMVIIGGVTRITNSGLSMVNWKFEGTLPPINDTEWQVEFDQYKLSPEGTKVNSEMTVSEFKKIYFWEYLHRMTGRLLGIIFIIPFFFFLIKKWFTKTELKKYFILLGLGAIQGGIGWFMVKSGLIDRPSVSHFRLAIHFVAALTLAAYIFWMIVDIWKIPKGNKEINKYSKYFLGVLTIQLIYGAFTAGLDAGHHKASNSISSLFGYYNQCSQGLDILNNDLNIQFIHRMLAWGILLFSVYIWKETRNTNLKKEGNIVLSLVLVQVILGISALLLDVQKHIAITHQFGAALLVLGTIYLIHQSQSNEKIQ
jgi:heme a synthase